MSDTEKDAEINLYLEKIINNKNQLRWSLIYNILISKFILGKNRLEYHKNVWYLRKKINILNGQRGIIADIEEPKILNVSSLSKKWQREVFGKKENKKINIEHLNIAFIIPVPIKGGGGHRNIFRAIKFMKHFGHEVTVYYTGTDEDAQTVRDNVNNWFYDMTGIPFIKFKGKTGYHDVGICTFWTTAYDMQSNIHKIKFPFYMSQDFEPMFYQIGSEYVLAENSYRLGFFHICSGPWCKDFLVKNYNVKADYFQFPIDKEIYNTSQQRTKENKNIIFFAKPEMPRRCYDIGIKALEYFHKLKPDIEIITFGSNCLDPKTIPFKTTNLGLLPTISDLANLYRNADLGLVFSTTNPSLVPYEMMSCECPVADLDIDLALSKYGNSKNNVFLVNSLPEKMADDLVKIFDNPKEMQKHQKYGKQFVDKEFPTEEEMGKIFEKIIKENITSKK